MEAADFLSRLFEYTTDRDVRLLLWTLPDKRSYWPKTVNEANQIVLANLNRCDVYYGVGFSPQDYGPTARCKEDDIAGIFGLWADIDFAGPGHQKPNLPEGMGQVQELFDKFGLPPSVMINSGSGVHAYWPFKETWWLDTPEERVKAKALSRQWQQTLREHALELGWDIDMTYDLSRILRVPGTFNRKHTPPRRVETLQQHWLRAFDPGDVEPYLRIVGSYQQTDPNAWQSISIQLNLNAEPPFRKFRVLEANDSSFKALWKHTRKRGDDLSASGWDFALAKVAGEAGWSDQEIADLLVANWQEFGSDPKTVSYLQHTIARAKGIALVDEALPEMLEGVADAAEPADTRRARLSRLLEVNILRIIKYMSTRPTYLLKTDRGDISLGTVDDLIVLSKFRSAVAAVAGRYVPNFSAQRWVKIAQTLLDLCEEESVTGDATELGHLIDRILIYLDLNHPREQDVLHALMGNLPFIYNGRTYISPTYFRDFLSNRFKENVTPRELAPLMSRIDATHHSLSARGNGKIYNRKFWVLPQWLADHEEPPEALGIVLNGQAALPEPAYMNENRLRLVEDDANDDDV